MSGRLLHSNLLACLLCAVVVAECAQGDDSVRETPLVRAVQQSKKSVVNIHTEKTAPDDQDSRFFTPKSRKVTGMGTGIIVDERGYIVTNYHVIQDVELITVTLDGGSAFDARPVSFDRKHDLAVIRITSTDPLTVMPMGTSSDVMLAETVYAVGNAYGYEHTITSGIVSALHRDVEVDETQAYENLIQTDASINPGNSGGPLLNLEGEVIGINVAIRSGAQRIGFAIPIDDARKTIARLLSVERLNGLPHGLTTTDVKTAESNRLRVDFVTAGSPAAQSGIQAGDVIRSVRGLRVQDGTDLERSLLDLPRGQQVTVVLERNGGEQALSFVVGGSQSAGTSAVSVSKSATSLQSSSSPTLVASAASQTTVAAAEPAATSNQTAQLPTESPSPSTDSAAAATAEAARIANELALVRAWDMLGLKLEPLSEIERTDLSSRTFAGSKSSIQYRGGMRIISVRAQSPASRFVKEGDILVGLDGFETLGAESLVYILGEENTAKSPVMKCQVFRQGSKPLEGSIALSISTPRG